MATYRLEVHHRVPLCLLSFFDRFVAGGLDGEGLQAWFDWEEAFRYEVDPDISREELEALIEASASPVPTTEHQASHSQAGEFARWGRRGGLRTAGPLWPRLVRAPSASAVGKDYRRAAHRSLRTPLCKGRP